MLDVGKLILTCYLYIQPFCFSSMLDVLWYNMVSEIADYIPVLKGSGSL